MKRESPSDASLRSLRQSKGNGATFQRARSLSTARVFDSLGVGVTRRLVGGMDLDGVGSLVQDDLCIHVVARSATPGHPWICNDQVPARCSTSSLEEHSAATGRVKIGPGRSWLARGTPDREAVLAIGEQMRLDRDLLRPQRRAQ